MKKIFILALLLSMPTIHTLHSQHKIMSLNIRFDNPADGPDRWEERKEELCGMLLEHHPDFIGIQESMPGQVAYIDQKLKDHSFIGFGRDGKGTESESVPLFYDRSKFRLLRSEVFWLSETPEKPSKGWDAALNRVTTYGLFENLKSGDTLHVFNTHFDHRGEVARKESAKLLARRIKSLGLADKKIILMGDLNSLPDEEPVMTLKEMLTDSRESSGNPPEGPVGTFNAFDPGKEPQDRIDYVFTLNARVLTYANLDEKRKNGRWISDHLPVMVELSE